MATSGALSTSNERIKYKIKVTVNSQNVTGNKSNVTVSVNFYRTNTGYVTYGTGTIYCRINGTEYSAAVTSAQKITENGIDLFTKTVDVSHSADGSKSLTVTAWINHSQFTSSQQSYTETLPTIARASQPSCITWPEHTQDVGEFGATISIHMNRKSDAFTHTVRYAFGNLKGTIATGVTTGTTWTIPLSFMDLLPNSTTGSGTIYADTYNGSTLIGTKYCGFTATVPSSVKPKCSVQVLDATNIKDTYGNLVKGLSKLQVNITGTPVYSSPIASYSSVVGYGGSMLQPQSYTDASYTTGALTQTGQVYVSASVKDGRGRSGSSGTVSFPVIDYASPAISSLTVHRVDANNVEDEFGDRVRVTFSAAVSPLNNKNSAAYTLRYKQSAAATYTTVALSALTGQYTVTDYVYTFAADSDYSYDVEVEARDDLNTTTRKTSASTGFTLMDWNDDGRSMAFGKVSEKRGWLENNFPTENIKTTVQLGNRYTLSSPGTAGSAGFVHVARISVTDLNADTPITFVLSRRNAETRMTVYVRLYNATSTSASVSTVRYEGTNYDAYLAPTSGASASNVWDLYVAKGSEYDTITLQDWYTSATMESRVAVTFPGTLVQSVPTPYYKATPAMLDSIRDYVYPVGSVYISYSHVNPKDLFGGTWERITNAFLWAVDSSGTIGLTGGEREHTLTVNEIPSHTHKVKMYWSNGAGSSSVMVRGLETADPKQYSTIYNSPTFETGGGAAHNNMPPYIQVSVWRRTA